MSGQTCDLYRELTRCTDAALYAELSKYCGGEGGKPGPCPKGEHDAHLVARAHANAAQHKVEEAKRKFGKTRSVADLTKLTQARREHQEAHDKALMLELGAVARGDTRTHRTYRQRQCPYCGRTISESAYSGADGNWKKHATACERRRAEGKK